MKHIRTLIVDEEGAARAEMSRLIEEEADLTLAGECAGSEEAVQALETHHPDLAVLAADMPGGNAFDVLKAASLPQPPTVIIVATSEQHALKAFDLHAADCLRKPFTGRRFREALQQARTQIRTGAILSLSDDLSALVDRLKQQNAASSSPYLQRVAVKTHDHITFVDVDAIDWIEAADNYVCLHAGDQESLLRTTMNELEDQLDPEHFARIHRSRIVNLDRVREARPQGSGDCVLVLTDGTRLSSSRTYSERRRQALNFTV